MLAHHLPTQPTPFIGRDNELADQLVLAVSTVKWYINQIFSKLYVNSRIQAIARARELNLLS